MSEKLFYKSVFYWLRWDLLFRNSIIIILILGDGWFYKLLKGVNLLHWAVWHHWSPREWAKSNPLSNCKCRNLCKVLFSNFPFLSPNLLYSIIGARRGRSGIAGYYMVNKSSMGQVQFQTSLKEIFKAHTLGFFYNPVKLLLCYDRVCVEMSSLCVII